MGWPKGKPRGPRKLMIKPPVRKVWTMKAGSNWDNAVEFEETVDRLHIPADQIPEGMDLRWVTTEVRGQPTPNWEANAKKTGWTPVHQSDFDGRYAGRFMSTEHDAVITVDGLTLMARPLELSIRARERDKREARDRVLRKERDIRGGNIPISGADHPSALNTNRINRSFERIEVPEGGPKEEI